MKEFRYTDKNSSALYKQLAADAYRQAINNTPGRSYVYMNINTGANVPSKVVFELFDEYCPKTCDNFRKLCEGYQQFDPETKQQGDKIGYAGAEFHRAVKGLYVQGGDLSRITAKSKLGLSIYGGQFADESFHIKHTEPGLIGMCKRGTIPNTNEC